MTILLDKMSRYDNMSGWQLGPPDVFGIRFPVFVPDATPAPFNPTTDPAFLKMLADAQAIARAAAQKAAAAAGDTAAADALLAHQAAVLNGPEPTTSAGYLERGSLRMAQAQMVDFTDPRFASWQLLAQQDFDKAKAFATGAQAGAAKATGASSSMMAYYAIAGLALAGGAFYFLKRK